MKHKGERSVDADGANWFVQTKILITVGHYLCGTIRHVHCSGIKSKNAQYIFPFLSEKWE